MSPATEEASVLYIERGAVALVTLNRPDALNSFTRQMHRELWAALDRAEAPAAASAPAPTWPSSTSNPGRTWCSAPTPAR